MARTIKITFIIIAFISWFILGFFRSSNVITTEQMLNFAVSAIAKSNKMFATKYKQYNIEPFPEGYNSTHLWSMRLADENYFRLASLLPCRNVTYAGGPKPDDMDSCDQSSENEFSLPNLISAQKWIYEHQNPRDCSNKRFAIIHRFAPSGFGSTVHQIAWALGIALADDRIAVYQTPGDWVR